MGVVGAGGFVGIGSVPCGSGGPTVGDMEEPVADGADEGLEGAPPHAASTAPRSVRRA